jgi:hypothetical protein
MERRRLLLVGLLATALVLTPCSFATAADECGVGTWGIGQCVSSAVGPNGVDLGTSTTDGGNDAESGITGSQPPPPNGTSPSNPNTPGDPTAITDNLGTCPDADRCRGGDAGTPSITLSDLASFSPSAPRIDAEPDGWALRGRPMNAIAAVSVNTHDGTLLGHPVTVRFTPTAYHWDWGDGTTKTTTTAGRTWEALGLPRFSETETSHTYAEKGTVTVTLAVDYTVDFQVDGGTWTTVSGTVDATVSEALYVGTATTVNVPGDCAADPYGVGC